MKTTIQSFAFMLTIFVLVGSCKKESMNTDPVLPTVTTNAVSSITADTAVCGGNVTSNGGAPVTVKGICWDVNPEPTTALATKTNDGFNVGSFVSSMSGLSAGTIYYVRAYASNSKGTAYGNQVTFTTNDAIITDLDGNIYTSVQIGTQEWMVENLKTTKYANGDPIANETDNAQWLLIKTGLWSHYNNDSLYENPYGKLYNWYATADPRNVCPTGWHVPTDAEWTLLSNFLGGDNVAGGKLKSTGTQYWGSPNQDATNESGFFGLPGGLRGFMGAFYEVGTQGYWWSSTAEHSYDAWLRYLDYNGGDVVRVSQSKPDGMSVRCLRD